MVQGKRCAPPPGLNPEGAPRREKDMNNETPENQGTPGPFPEAPASGSAQARLPRAAAWPRLAAIAAIAALTLSGWQLLTLHQKFAVLRAELGQQLARAKSANEADRLMAANAQEAARETLVKLGVLQNTVAQYQGQAAALQSLYQQLASTQDQRSLADIEQLLLDANQQAQLAGNVHAALIALELADNQLATLDRPQLYALRAAIRRDIGRLKALPAVDVVGISLELDDLAHKVDSLPFAYDGMHGAAVTAERIPAPKSPWERFGQEIWSGLRQLVQIQKVSTSAPPLLAPSQRYFFRENVKLRLLTARIALLQHDSASYQRDIRGAQRWIGRYCDTQAPATRAALGALDELARTPISVRLPDISDSLEAFRRYQMLHGGGTQ